MKISSYDVSMASESSYSEISSSSTKLQVWVDTPDRENTIKIPIDILDISSDGKELSKTQNGNSEYSVQLSDEDLQKINLLEEVLRRMFGKRFKFLIPRNIKVNQTDIKLSDYKNISEIRQPSQQQNVGWGMIFEHQSSYQESQKMTFQSSGTIKTADGKEIKFDLELKMSRQFAEYNNINIRAGDALKVDPLVINYSGNAASLTNTKYSFDIDNNGISDNISFVGPDSGFLALDKNGDNIINNGSELFGPQSGNGFSDLSAYDQDKNGWIDENDSIFNNLRIWSKDEKGNDYLFSLGEKGVGAIYLGNISTQFDLKDSLNNTDGQIQRTGIFLKESGLAGTIQHIDLTI